MLYHILAASTGLITLIIFFIIQGTQKEVKNKKVLLINLLFALIITLFGCIGLIKTIEDTDSSRWWFVALQLVFLILGSVFYFLLQKDFFGKLKSQVLSHILLLVSNVALGFVGFSLLFSYFLDNELGFYYALSSFVFFIPYGFMFTFNLLVSIPPEIHKIWYYPLDMAEPDFDNIDTNNIYLLELELLKSPGDDSMKNYLQLTTVRAPVNMIFGEWFRYFINNYNYKFEENPIRFLDKSGEPHGWIFSTKPQSLWKSKKYIDPDLTIKNNKLTDKTVIVAKRVEVEN